MAPSRMIIERASSPLLSIEFTLTNSTIRRRSPVRIRVETIDYFLRRYREDIIKRRGLEKDIEAQLAAFEQSLRSQPMEGLQALAGD